MNQREKETEEDQSGPRRGNVALQRLRSAMTMRRQNLIAYGDSFSEPSLIDPKTAPKLSRRQRMYLRAYDRLYQKFIHSYTILAEIKERREREGIGFQFPLPDPEAIKDEVLVKMRSIIGEGAYDGYERALEYEQKEQGLRANESLIIGNEEEFL